MKLRLSGILALPDAATDQAGDEVLSKSFLMYAIAFVIAGSMAYEVVLFNYDQGVSLRALSVLNLVLIAVVAWLFLVRGSVRASAWWLGVGVWTQITISTVVFGGINTPSAYMYPLVILLAGWHLGHRAAMVAAWLTTAVTLCAALAESYDLLPVVPPNYPAMRWVIQCFVFVLSALLISHVVRTYRQRLAEVGQLGRDLARRTIDLEASEADLHRAQAVAHIGSWVFDIRADRMRLSAETCRIFGLTVGTEGSHDTYMSRVHPDDREAIESAWQAALVDGALFDSEHRILVGKATRWVRQMAEFARDADGKPLRAVGTTHEITERKQAADALQRTRSQLAATLDAIPDLLFEVDIEGRYLDCHSPQADLLIAPREELLGRTVAQVLPPAAAATSMAALREAFETGGSQGRRFELPLAQGVRWFELSISRKPVEPGSEPRFIVLSRDITKRQRAEAAVVALNQSLEKRVRERTIELQDANRELENFSYTISHDLRAPLRSIVGFSGLLTESLDRKLSPEDRNHLERIAASGNKMSRLIDRVLEYSRLSRSALAPRTVEVDALVREVVDELGDQYPAAEVLIEALGTVDADPTMLRQIFHNLIGNALKYSARAAHPRVEIGTRIESGAIEYFVRDNGIGFDMAHAEHLFTLFTRLHSDPGFEGNGAGLAIVKRLVERHNGWIRAEAAPGLGALFRFCVQAPGAPFSAA